MHLFGFELSPTVVLGGITSLLLSIIGFFVGTRVAREGADRALLRKLYQDIYAHFRNLKDAAEETRPRQWTDYIKGDLFLPLVRSLERDGSLNVIPSSLAARFLETERVTLETGYRFTHMVEEKLVPLVEAVIRQKVADSNVSISGKSYGVINVGTIVLDPRFRENMVTRFRDGTLGCGIELSAQRGRSRSLYLNPEKISSEGIVDVLTEIGARAGEDEVIRSRASELRQSIGTLERALKTVADRIKEPNPFLETLIGLLPKIGKRPNRQSRAV